MIEIVLATKNANKTKEIAEIVHPIVVKSLDEAKVEIDLSAVEDGDSYEENAVKKARKVREHVTGIVVADDSGLEIKALGGAPGIHSARFGGEGLTDKDRCALVLKKLEGIPEGEREARFVCVAVVLFPDERLETFYGTCSGTIATSPAGTSGFGYDPVFYLPGLGKTMAELATHEKHRISHRGIAFRKLRDFLLRL